MKKYLLFAMALFTLTFVACGDDDDDEETGNNITNIMVLRGTTYPIEMPLFFAEENGLFYNLDCDTKGGVLHGYGGFEGSLVGKTTPLKGQFFLSFNPQSGGYSIDPIIASGSVTIKKVNEGLWILVDCKEESGDIFTMNFLAKDEAKMRQ